MIDNDLLNNIDKIKTTELGLIRIKKNLNIECNPVEYCKDIIKKSNIIKKGKNYYCYYNNIIVTVNSFSYSIITAHYKK